MTARQVLELLQRYESRNVTFIDPDDSWPIVWKRARGVRVWDAEGNAYLDLTAAFGVAAAGHANPRVVKAGQRQMATLLHAMGDVHPHALKAKLARELSRITFERWTEFKVQGSRFKVQSPTGDGQDDFLQLRSRGGRSGAQDRLARDLQNRDDRLRGRLSRGGLRRLERDPSRTLSVSLPRAAWLL